MIDTQVEERSKVGWLGLTVAVLLSAGWLVPAGLGIDSVLSFLNEDMARLSVLRNIKPGFALPTEFNEAPNMVRARQYLTGAGVWFALVIVGWTVYIARAKRALQWSREPAGDLLRAHRHALDSQLGEFTQQVERHRRELESEFGSLSHAAVGTRGMVHERFDAVQSRLSELDSAVEQQLDALKAVASRVGDGLQTAETRRDEQTQALRESLQTVAGQLGEQIRAARGSVETQHQGEQEQRFVSVHNAVQVLGAQLESRFEAARAQREAGLATQDEHLARLGERFQHFGFKLEQHLEQQLATRMESALQALGERLQMLLSDEGQQQQAGRQDLLAAVQALREPIDEALQLQRAAGAQMHLLAEGDTNRQAAHRADQEAQTQTLADLAGKMDHMAALAQSLHEQRSRADDSRDQVLQERLLAGMGELTVQIDQLRRSGEAGQQETRAAQQQTVETLGSRLDAQTQALQALQGLQQGQQEPLQALVASTQEIIRQQQAQAERGDQAAAALQSSLQASWESGLQHTVQGLHAAVGDGLMERLRSVVEGSLESRLTPTLQSVLQPALGAAFETALQQLAQRFDEGWRSLSQQARSEWQAHDAAVRERIEGLSAQLGQAREALGLIGQDRSAWRQDLSDGLHQGLQGLRIGLQDDQQQWTAALLASDPGERLARLQQQLAALDERVAQQQAAAAALYDGEQSAWQSRWQMLGQELNGQLRTLQDQLAPSVAGAVSESLRGVLEQRPTDSVDVEALAARVAERAAAQAADRAADRAAERVSMQAADPASVHAIEQAAERATERAAERAVERVAEQAAARAAEQAARSVADQVAERAATLADRSALQEEQARQAAQLQASVDTALQAVVTQLSGRIDSQRDAWVREREALQAEQAQALQALAADLSRSIEAAQSARGQFEQVLQLSRETQAGQEAVFDRWQQQERRLDALHAMAERIDHQQQAAQQQRQAEQGAMMLALDRRMSTIDTLEAQIERLEGMLTRAGVHGVAARLAEIEAILSAHGPARLETRLGQLEDVLVNTARQFDTRMDDLHGRMTQAAGFTETTQAPPAERLFDEKRLQHLFLNLSDLQENLRLERRQLRKKLESLKPPSAPLS